MTLCRLTTPLVVIQAIAACSYQPQQKTKMGRLRQVNFKHVFLIILLAIGLILSYLAGTISVEARFMNDGTRIVTINQKAAVSAAVSLLLLGNGQSETLYLPLIVR